MLKAIMILVSILALMGLSYMRGYSNGVEEAVNHARAMLDEIQREVDEALVALQDLKAEKGSLNMVERTTDIDGRRYGKLTVIGYGHRGKYRTYYRCRCECGNECEVARQNLTSGKTRSCGCLRTFAHARGPKKGGKPIVLTEAQEKWLIKHYQHTKNDVCAAKLGISQSSLHRYARKFGLQKSKQFMNRCIATTTAAAKLSHERNGTYPPKGYVIPGSEDNRFRKGETNEMRLGKRRNRERIEKSAASLRRTREIEKSRVAFGLPQQTKLLVKVESSKKRCQRYYLRKLGYIIDRGSNVAYYDERTQRSMTYENRKRGDRHYVWFDFRPLPDSTENK